MVFGQEILPVDFAGTFQVETGSGMITADNVVIGVVGSRATRRFCRPTGPATPSGARTSTPDEPDNPVTRPVLPPRPALLRRD